MAVRVLPQWHEDLGVTRRALRVLEVEDFAGGIEAPTYGDARDHHSASITHTLNKFHPNLTTFVKLIRNQFFELGWEWGLVSASALLIEHSTSQRISARYPAH